MSAPEGGFSPEKDIVDAALKTRLSRRDLFKRAAQGGAAAALGAALSRASLRPESAAAASSAEAVGSSALALPVAQEERDPRLKRLPKTRILVSKELIERGGNVPIDDIELNTRDYSKTEAQNRLDMAIANHLARMYAVSQEYVNGDDFSQLQNMLMSGELPPEPNPAEFIRRLESDEDFFLPIVAVPEGKEETMESLEITKFDVKKGVRIRFTNTPGLMSHLGGYGDDQSEGFTFRVTKDNQLQYDLYFGDFLNPNSSFLQNDIINGHTELVKAALETGVLTLGNYSNINGQQANWYNMYSLHNYEGRRKELGLGLFSDQVELLMGEIKEIENDYGMIVPRPMGPMLFNVKSSKIPDSILT